MDKNEFSEIDWTKTIPKSMRNKKIETRHATWDHHRSFILDSSFPTWIHHFQPGFIIPTKGGDRVKKVVCPVLSLLTAQSRHFVSVERQWALHFELQLGASAVVWTKGWPKGDYWWAHFLFTLFFRMINMIYNWWSKVPTNLGVQNPATVWII